MLDKSDAEDIIWYMEHGIEIDNNKVLTFRLLDYYLFTTVSFDKFIDFVYKNLGKKEREILIAFVSKNSCRVFSTTEKSLTSLKCNHGIINLSEKEKEEAINFMKINNLPVSSYLFDQIVGRYIEGTIDLDCDYLKLNHYKRVMRKILEK